MIIKGRLAEEFGMAFTGGLYIKISLFSINPRLSMMVRTLNKMDKQKLESHLKISEEYLSNLV